MPSESSQSSTQWHTSTLKIDRRAPVDTTDWRTVTSHSPPHPHLEVPLEPPFSIPLTLQLLDFPELQKGQTHSYVDVYYPDSQGLNSSSTSFYLITPGGQQHPEQISTCRTARLRIIRYSTTNPVSISPTPLGSSGDFFPNPQGPIYAAKSRPVLVLVGIFRGE